MSDKRVIQPRYGDAPSKPGQARSAPLPLLTQPMIPVEPGEPNQDGMTTRIVDNPLHGVGAAAAVFSRTTTMTAMVAPAIGRSPAVSGPPSEIGLTQHHLPDEKADPRLTLVIDPDSERAAAFRVLRHHLLEIGRPQCIAVTSAGQGDGKTTTAVNLALALSECGRAKVLLVETHVRRPQLSTIFKLVPPWCFAEQLAAHRHQPMLPWSLVEIPSLWLHVGAINPRIEKTQLLDGPAFSIAMERLRLGGYDHIVVDGPPVLGSADANLMADAVDAVVLAVRAERTTARDLRRAIDQLGAEKVAGTVLVT